MATTLIIKNKTSDTKQYLSGAVSINANDQISVSIALIYPICRDPDLINDCKTRDIIINDGVQDYTNIPDTMGFLNQIATGIGGAVVGYAGASVPSFQITVGGRDSTGKSQPARMNQFSDLVTNYRNLYNNIVGNTTVVVKSSAGTLHGIMINRNWTGGTITIYDNTAGSGTKIATIDIGSPSGGLLSSNGIPGATTLGPLGLEFTTGLTVVTSGSSSNNITILYQ